MNSRRQAKIFYGWIVVAITFTGMGLGYGVWYSFTAFFLAVLEEFHLSRADAALAFSVFVFVHGLSGPLAGWAIERFTARLVYPIGAVLLAASLAVASQSREAWQFYLAFGVFASAAINFIGAVVTFAVLSRWFVKRRALAFGVANAGIGTISIFAMVPFTQYLISTVGWRSTYLVLAAIMLVAIPPLAYFIRNRPSEKGLSPDGSAPPAAAEPGRQTGQDYAIVDRRWVETDWTMRAAMRTWRFWALCIIFFLTTIVTQTVFVHQTAYFVGLGHSPMTAATVVGLIGLVSIPGKVGFGWLADRIGRELSYTIGASLAVAAQLLLLILPAVNIVPLMLLFAVLFGLGYAVIASMAGVVAADFFSGRRFGVIFAVLAFAQQVGSALGAWFAGLVYDLTGAYTLAFGFAIVAAILTIVGLWIVGPRRVRLAAGPAARAARKVVPAL